MASRDRSEKPISEVLKIAFEALKKHEKHMDKITAKLEQEKDGLNTGTAKISKNLEEISQRLSALEQETRKLKQILQT